MPELQDIVEGLPGSHVSCTDYFGCCTIAGMDLQPFNIDGILHKSHGENFGDSVEHSCGGHSPKPARATVCFYSTLPWHLYVIVGNSVLAGSGLGHRNAYCIAPEPYQRLQISLEIAEPTEAMASSARS